VPSCAVLVAAGASLYSSCCAAVRIRGCAWWAATLARATANPVPATSGFLPVPNTAHGPGGTRVPCLLDRSAGSKTNPIEMTVIDRALCAVDLAR
jgi:hypothetical protein